VVSTDGEIVERKIKKKEVEVVFRNRGEKERKVEVVEKLNVMDWDGTKAMYDFVFAPKKFQLENDRTSMGSVGCPVVIY
jgi:hypothetical protein